MLNFYFIINIFDPGEDIIGKADKKQSFCRIRGGYSKFNSTI